MIVTGTIVTAVLLVHRAHCDDVLASRVCQGYTNSIHRAYLLIAFRMICFIAAGPAATNFRRRKKNSHSPADQDGREGVLH
jgi:hypothetical protein